MHKEFTIENYVRTFPGSLIVPQFSLVRTGRLLREPEVFLLQMRDGKLMDWLLLCERTREYVTPKLTKKSSKDPIAGMGRSFSDQTIKTYGKHLKKFLAWSEWKGCEAGDYEKFNPMNLASTHDPLGQRGSLESFLKDMLSREEFTSQNARIISTIGAVVNSYLLFLVAYGVRTRDFVPYHFSVPKTWAAQTKKPKPTQDYPYPTELKKWVMSSDDVRIQAIRGLACFGGLRRSEILSQTRETIPSQSKVRMVSTGFRMELCVFGKGSKWRTTTIPFFFYKTLWALKTNERQRLHSSMLHRTGKGLRRPKSDEPLFLSTNARNFGKALSEIIVQKAFDDVPFSNWKPHSARHAFAVNRLTELTLAQMNGIGTGHLSKKEFFERAILMGTPLDTLRRELGHVNQETTSVYLMGMRERVFDGDAIELLRRDLQEFYRG
ncbi:hypothetical protein [Aliiroseovarius sp. 2305UL8-7]|uniref:hypothetical protein n=1 Tax=Aliiroseovarius conchicola TaxID=3121637 RepID=UPI003528AD03